MEVNCNTVASTATLENHAPDASQQSSCDASKRSFSFQEKLKKPLKFHLAFFSILLMVLIVSVDATALAIVIPVSDHICVVLGEVFLSPTNAELQTITKEFNGTSLQAFWANSSFLLSVTVTLPVYTGLSEVLGRKLPLYFAFFLFTTGAIIFATAQSLPIVIFARALQGTGCGGLDVLNEILVADITTLRERAFYIGLISIPFALGSILGPVVGALLTEFVSWRWIGWIHLPLVAICLPLSIFCLTLQPLEGTLKQQLIGFDWCGLALFMVGSISLTLPLSWAGTLYPGRSWKTLVPFFIGVSVLGVFGWYESKASQPIFPHRFFRNRNAAAALALSFVHGMIFYTLTFHLPLFFQSVNLETPIQSSVSLLPFYAVLMAFTGIAAIGVEWTRRYIWEVRLSWALLSLGLGLLTLLGTHTTLAQTVAFQAITAIGLGSLFTVLPITIQASTKPDDHSPAVGILVSFRLFGASVGLAISDSAFSNHFSSAITSLQGILPDTGLFRNESQALGSIPRLRELHVPVAAIGMIQNVYQLSFRVVFLVLTGLSCFGLLLTFLADERSIESDELSTQAFTQ